MKLKLCLLLIFVITYSWSQAGSTKTFTGNGTFSVPAGVTSLNVQAWGGGGSGGGASGAPLLLGRGAAGGGGGAFAGNNIVVTPGTTLNVVVASQTSATTGAGTAGGNSTITGFESSILAAGGSGGDANNAGGSPTGGAGGTVAASAGSVRFAGANGGNGNSWNLLGLLLSSGAGGAGASSGGAGGTAVSGLILSNAPGNAGSPPGGAGSGAINSALGAAQIGGAGAAGRVIISYNCANFSLTSTAATSVCNSTGTTSTVTLTGSAASLPVGNYVVTYNRSSPNATALTANLTVSTAGTGTFTAVGLTTAGSSTITITKLTSETCSSTITTNNTTTITVSPATVGGTVNGGTTINPGSTSGLLTLSGQTGTIVKWQSSVSPFSTWTDIANTATTYTSGPLTATTQFRAVVQSGICGVANSAATTVTVNPRPTITLASSAVSRCSTNDGSPSQIGLDYTATTESPTTYSIVWNSSPANSFVAVTDAALPANSIPIAIPAGVVPATYTGILTVKNANGAVSSPGSTFTVTINETPLITTTGIIASVCTSTNSQNATLAYSGVTGNPVGYSIDWNFEANSASLADQGNTPFVFAPGGGSIKWIAISANVPAGTYSGVMYIFNGTCSQFQLVSITIAPATVGGTVSGGTSICYGNTSGELTLSGQTGTIVKWQSSVSPFSTWTDIANTVNTYTSGVLTETTQFRAVVDNGICGVANSEATTVTVEPLPTITLASPSIDICSLSDSLYFDLPYSGTTGSPVTYSIVWDAAGSAIFDTDTDLTLNPFEITIENIASPPPGNYTGTITVKNAAGCVSPGLDFTVIVNPLPTVTITSATSIEICADGNTNYPSIDYSATGEPTTYSIVWSSSSGNNFENVTDVALPENSIQVAVPGDAAAGTYKGTLTVKNANGCVSSIAVFTVSVNNPPSITSTGTIDAVCTSVNAQNATLSYAASTGNPDSYWIDWNNDANSASLYDQGETSFTFDPNGGIINTIEIPANVPAGTYSGIMHLGDGICSADVPVTIEVSPATVGGTVSGGTSICYGNPSGELTLSGYTGSIVNWQSSVSPFTTWTDIANTDPTYTSEALTETTQFRAVVQNGICGVANSEATTVIVNPLPTVTITSPTSIAICADGNTNYPSIDYSATGEPTTYSIVWSSSSGNNFENITDVALPENSIQVAVPGDAAAGTYKGTLTVKNANGCVSSIAVFTVSVNNPPSITSTGTIDAVCTSVNAQNATLSYAASTGNPDSYWIDWNNDANSASLYDQGETSFTFDPNGGIINTIEIPANVPAGTYSGIMHLGDGICSADVPVTITINPLPTAPVILDITPPATASQGGIIDLGGLPSGNWSLLINPIAYTASGSGEDVIINNIPVGEYTFIVTDTATGCSSVESETAIVRSRPTIELGSITDVCSDGSASSAPLSYSATTGSPVTYSIVWDASPANSFVAVTDAALPASPITIDIPGGTDPGTYTGTLTVKDANGISSLGSTFSLTINAIPTIAVTTVAPVTTSANPQTTTLTYSAGTGTASSYYIEWHNASLQAQNVTPFIFSTSGGTIDTIEISANAPAGTYTGTFTIGNGICESSQEISIVISDPVLPTIALFSYAQTRCSTNDGSASETTLEYTGTTGNPTTYSIVWDSSPANNFVAVTDASLPASLITIAIPAGVTAGVYLGTLTVKNADGAVSSPGSAFSVTINETPLITTTGTIDPVNTSTVLNYATLEYSGVTGNPISYYIDWNFDANSASLADQADTPFTFDPNGGTINTIEIPANVSAGTYLGTMYIYNGICYQFQLVSITINPVIPPTIELESSIIYACSDSNAFNKPLYYEGTTGSPTTYSIVWNSSPANSFVAVTDATLSASPLKIKVPAGTVGGTYTGTLTVKDANGVSSEGLTFDVNVIESPTITTTGIMRPVCSSNNSQSSFLQYTASTGNPVSYSIDWDDTANAASLLDMPETSDTFLSSGSQLLAQISANALPGTYSGTLVITNESCSGFYPVSITISTGTVGGTVTGGTTITSGSTSGLLTLSGSTGFVNTWQYSVSPFTTWTNIDNTFTETYTSGPLTETTQFRVRVQRGSCFIVNSEPTTVTVNPAPTIAINPSPSSGTTDLKSLKNPIIVSALDKVINVETPNQIIDKVYIFDVSGNLIYEKVGVSDPKLVITDLRSSNQVLVVKVILNNNQTETRKVVF